MSRESYIEPKDPIMTERIKSEEPADRRVKTVYESPKIEEILTPSDLEREVHYAGRPASP